MPSSTAGIVEDGAGALPGGWHKVTVDLVGDLDALVAEPAGHLGDRDALGQGGGGIEVAQGMRDELQRQAGPGCGALEVFLVTAAHDQLVLSALEQVPVGRGAVPGDVLVDRLADVIRQRDVAELPFPAEL